MRLPPVKRSVFVRSLVVGELYLTYIAQNGVLTGDRDAVFRP